MAIKQNPQKNNQSALKHAIENIAPLSKPEMASLLQYFQCWSLAKDSVVLREKQISDFFYFVESGVARIYYKKYNKEITEWIAMDHQFMVSIISFFQRQPSRLIIHTLEPTLLWGIHYNHLMQLCAKHHAIETLLRKMLTTSLVLSQQRMDAIQFESAQQRYSQLLHHSPEMLQRVPLSFIASFLGITLETLSRIRGGKDRSQ